VAGRAFGIKMGDDGGRGTASSDGVASTRTVGASTFTIVPCTIKSRNNDGEKLYCLMLGITPLAPPRAYANNPARMQHNALQSVVFMMIARRINCEKAGDFGSVPGILIH